jgi:hypothetical protein
VKVVFPQESLNKFKEPIDKGKELDDIREVARDRERVWEIASSQRYQKKSIG